MQFADPKSATETYPEELTAPQALRAELPSDITASRLVIACTLDRSGLLKTSRVVEGNSPELSEKVLAALPRWKFRPAFRGNQPIEVNAILGFDIDTR
jgi:outer membrane biosynthesis protein TonB